MMNTEYYHYQISTSGVFDYLTANNITLDEYPDWNLIKKTPPQRRKRGQINVQ